MKRLYIVAMLALVLGTAGCARSAPDIESTRQACYANEAAVVAAATRAYADGKAMGADWTGVMNVIVPKYLDKVPTCPGGGVYSLTQEGGVVKPICSLHGSAEDPATRP
jgi:hypothetical protein